VKLALELLAIQRRTLGDRHFRTLNTLLNLSINERILAHYDDAEAHATEFLNAHKATSGDAHPATGVAKVNLGTLLAYRGEFERATAYVTDGLDSLMRSDGPEGRSTLAAMMYQAEILALQSNYAQAEVVLTRVADVRRRVSGAAHVDTLRALAWLGWVQFKAHKDAGTTLRDAVAGYEQSGARDWLRFRSLAALGESLAARRAFQESEPLLKAGALGLIDTTSMIPVRYHAVVAEAADWARALYDAWGKPEEAAQWQRRAAAGTAPGR
jgi:hypothetical protein